jgi:hypothetical protein
MTSIPRARTGRTEELPTAMNARHAQALVTTIVRGKNLLFDGYTIDAQDKPGLYTVSGQPTVARRTGKVTPHGPYSVDTVAGTCTCEGFANHGDCKHLECCRDLEAGKVPLVREALESTLWALEATKQPGKRLVTEDGLLKVYRSEGLAINDARANRAEFGDLTPTAIHLKAVLEERKYRGLFLITRTDTHRVPFCSEIDGEGEDPTPNTQQVGRAHENPYAGWREDVAAAIAQAPSPDSYCPRCGKRLPDEHDEFIDSSPGEYGEPCSCPPMPPQSKKMVWRVWSDTGTFAGDHDTEEGAEASARRFRRFATGSRAPGVSVDNVRVEMVPAGTPAPREREKALPVQPSRGALERPCVVAGETARLAPPSPGRFARSSAPALREELAERAARDF